MVGSKRMKTLLDTAVKLDPVQIANMIQESKFRKLYRSVMTDSPKSLRQLKQHVKDSDRFARQLLADAQWMGGQ